MKNKKPLRFEYWKSNKNGQWYWRLKARNGEPVAQGEGYKSKRGVFNVYDALYGWAAELMIGHSHWPEAVDINAEAFAKFKSSIRGFPAPKKLAKKKPRLNNSKLNRSWP